MMCLPAPPDKRRMRCAPGLLLGLAAALIAPCTPTWAAGTAALLTAPDEPTTSSPGWFPPDTVIRSLLAERVEAGHAVGLVLGLLDPDGTSRVLTEGRSNGPGDRPLDGATLFEIGSVTKVFTAALLAEMAHRGEVRLEQPVAELLPRAVAVPAWGDTPITLLDLATHHSGLPRLPANLTPRDPADPYADYTVARLYEFLGGHRLARAPGERYEYSNLGAGLLGHALARRAGKPYERLLKERVLDPLGMRDTRVTLDAGLEARLAAGHDPAGARVPNWTMTSLAGAGALRSTARDLLRFLAAHLDSNGTAISAALRESHRPRRDAGGRGARIGLAWHVLQRFGAEIVMHNGGTGGYRSFIGYDPAMRVGVVLLSNSSVDQDDLALHLLNPRYPLKRIVKRTEVTLDPARLDGLVGRYALAPTFVLTVTREGGALFIQATGQSRLPVYATSDTTFFYRAVEAEVTFSRDASGRATRIVLHQNGRDLPGGRVE